MAAAARGYRRPASDERVARFVDADVESFAFENVLELQAAAAARRRRKHGSTRRWRSMRVE